MNTLEKFYSTKNSMFKVISIAIDEERDTVIAELEMDGKRSVDIFEFQQGKIFREREYYDDLYWTAEMKDDSKEVNGQEGNHEGKNEHRTSRWENEGGTPRI